MLEELIDNATISILPSNRHNVPQRRESLPLPLTDLILCGGRSRRMGRTKAFLPFAGKTIIEHLLSVFNQLFDETLLVASEPEAFSHLGCDVVKDILPNRGPLCGILSGLLVSAHEKAFVIACDMPLVDKRLIRQICEARHDHDVVVLSHKGLIEPLFGIYSKSCIKSLEDALFSGVLTESNLLSGVKAQAFEYLTALQAHDQLPTYFNINTPQDYSKLLNALPCPNRWLF